ncbi:diguanylate cyclase (GGDEF)-like protein/PAS domain S-box-containing protein [Chitinivorax tropicus]|uniref:Diguanylate cyclase (GGDEF)-like protein/PAS domain S-box-containing protein n=1 Tax=Chitinivorax tropicus TaxID=714531 RepID=A0A840MQM2_9PROT|nr:PAS-domain containing protein [Chitinivorax tropicus]MBB5019387.1 diguanylate cyclase (GGDEF)-like protein/PAS domain S-box-containing protein [Chitinivorax tropicus]
MTSFPIFANDLAPLLTLDASSLPSLALMAEHLPCGLTVINDTMHVLICNQRCRQLLGLPSTLFETGPPSFEQIIRFNAERGEYGEGDPDRIVAEWVQLANEHRPHVFERSRPNGIRLEIRGIPLTGGGFVSIYNDITQRNQAIEDSKRYAAYLRTVIESLPQGISVIDEHLNMVLWNKAFFEVLALPESLDRPGVTFEELLWVNANRGEYGPGDPAAQVAQRISLAMQFQPHKFNRTRPDGTELEIVGKPMDVDGQVVGFISTYTDITPYKRAEAAVRHANALMEDAISYSPTYIWELDADGCFVFIKGGEKILGYQAEEMIGNPLSSFLAPEQGIESNAVLSDMKRRRAYKNGELRYQRKDGGIVWVSSNGHPLYDDMDKFIGFRGVDVDITELTQARSELERMAWEDPLTHLANRYRLLDRFELEVDRAHRNRNHLSLLVADIDHFKSINDRFGHLFGDHCLRMVAEKLQQSVRAVDLVSRFGGEEFVVLLPDTNLAGAFKVAEHIRQAIENNPIKHQTPQSSETLKVTISIGIATSLLDQPIQFDDLMGEADEGLYQAKRQGRNRVISLVPPPTT